MTSSGLVELSSIRSMLKNCLGDYTEDQRKHRMLITSGGKDYWLPLGSHADRGKRSGRMEVKRSEVEAMVGQLGIDRDCARKYVPSLRAKKASEGKSVDPPAKPDAGDPSAPAE